MLTFQWWQRTRGLFLRGDEPVPCADAADANDDGRLDISDGIRSLSFQFLGTPGSTPAPPGPYRCGPDVGVDNLPDCEYLEWNCQ